MRSTPRAAPETTGPRRLTLLRAAATECSREVEAYVVDIARSDDRDGRGVEPLLVPSAVQQRRRLSAQLLLQQGRVTVVGACEDPDPAFGQPLELECELPSASHEPLEPPRHSLGESELATQVLRRGVQQRVRAFERGLTQGNCEVMPLTRRQRLGVGG